MSEQRDMSGALFRTKEKRGEKSPDFTGRLVVAGVTYRLSGWKKASKSGETYLSLAVREADDSGRPARVPQDDDISF